jgi:glycosyltransferase involved in cell wall biosynthesis
MASEPLVSVVVPVLDGAATIGAMLAALQAQSLDRAAFEVIVVDNGSRDRTREIVAGFGVRLLDEARPGPSAARNRGIRAAVAGLIAHLDADTLPTRTWLAELLAPFTDPKVVLVGGRTLSFRPETPAERYIEACGHYTPGSNVFRSEFPFVPSMNMAVRRTPALEIGGFAEHLRTAEDVDFSYRLLRHTGAAITYQPRAVLFHRNRRDGAALRRQAWNYGYGAAQMYRCYPEALRWDLAKSLRVAQVLLARTAMPLVGRVQNWLGLISRDEVEFADYHRLWTWSWWRGFFAGYRRERRAGTEAVTA